MRKSAAISLLAIALFLVPAMPSYAWRGHPSVFIGVGPGWWGPAYPYWYYPPPPYYVYSPPPVVIQEPSVYVQPPPPAPPETYWYYCSSARAYYPTVQACPEAWIRVPPRPQ